MTETVNLTGFLKHVRSPTGFDLCEETAALAKAAANHSYNSAVGGGASVCACARAALRAEDGGRRTEDGESEWSNIVYVFSLRL
jgi:hypothetical protein